MFLYETQIYMYVEYIYIYIYIQVFIYLRTSIYVIISVVFIVFSMPGLFTPVYVFYVMTSGLSIHCLFVLSCLLIYVCVIKQ
jgi:hypothetical protein